MTKPFIYWIRILTAFAFCIAITGPVSGGDAWRTQTAPKQESSNASREFIIDSETPELLLDPELDRIFRPAMFSAPAAFRGAEFRRWRDNTGSYDVEARLAVVFPDKVRLLKPNGRTTTVSMARLSTYDQDYVRWVAQSLVNEPTHLVELDPTPNQSGY